MDGWRANPGFRLARCVAPMLVGGALALSSAAPAAAHAELILASPAPGIGLPQAPGAVVVKFTEPLNLALSRIEVLDRSGRDVGEGPTLSVEGDAQAMRRKLGLLPTGQYSVRWTTVSTLDGHTLQGSYHFGVGTVAQGGSEVRASPLDSEGALGLLGRYVALAGLTLWAGSVLLRHVVSRAGFIPRRVDLLARLAPSATCAGAAMSITSSAITATGSVAAVGGVIASSSGTFQLLVLVASALGAIVGPRPWLAAVFLALAAIVGEAASGHAAAAPVPIVAVTSFGAHLGAVGVWVWAIVASVSAATDLRRALAALTPYAVGAAIVTALTGTVNAATELTGPADLLGTAYGLTLLWKVGAFAAMATLGLLHYRWRHRAEIGEARLRQPVRAEAGAALVALALATTLVGFPNPPRETEAAERLAGIDPVLAELGAREAASVAEASGPFVVGFTILPPRPGPVELRVQVVGIEPGDGLRDARVAASTDGGAPLQVPLTACGTGCFAGQAQIGTAGDWGFRVAISSNRGPLDVALTMPLPTADGSSELARALSAMERLHTARIDEHLKASVGGPDFVTIYRFRAPDRTEMDVGGGQRIIIGERDFSRPNASGPWTASSFPAPGFSWPGGYYSGFWKDPAAARMIGSETVDGVASRIVAFVRPDVRAWFRLWVGVDDGLVRRMEMRAEGHLMDQAYSGLDSPLSIEAPT